MKEDPELNKKLSEVEEKQNRWIGRRIEAHDAPKPSTEQAFAAAAPAMTMTEDNNIEQLPVGSSSRPSGQGGEEQKVSEHFQQTINRLEKSLRELKQQTAEAYEAQKKGQGGGKPGDHGACQKVSGPRQDFWEVRHRRVVQSPQDDRTGQ